LWITNSLFTGNQADLRCGLANEATARINNSTFSGNQANSSAGGIYSAGNQTLTTTKRDDRGHRRTMLVF